MSNPKNYDQIKTEVLGVLENPDSTVEDCLAAAERGRVELPYAAKTREEISAALWGRFKDVELERDDRQRVLAQIFRTAPAGSKTHREATKLFLESVARPGAPQPASAAKTAQPE